MSFLNKIRRSFVILGIVGLSATAASSQASAFGFGLAGGHGSGFGSGHSGGFAGFGGGHRGDGGGAHFGGFGGGHAGGGRFSGFGFGHFGGGRVNSIMPWAWGPPHATGGGGHTTRNPDCFAARPCGTRPPTVIVDCAWGRRGCGGGGPVPVPVPVPTCRWTHTCGPVVVNCAWTHTCGPVVNCAWTHTCGPVPVPDCRWTHSCGPIPVTCRTMPWLAACRPVIVPPVYVRPPVYTPGPAYVATAPGYVAAPAAYTPAPAQAPVAPAACLKDATIWIVFQPNATANDISALLKGYNVTLENGPDANAVYRLRITTIPSEQVGQLIEALRAQTTIVNQVGA